MFMFMWVSLSVTRREAERAASTMDKGKEYEAVLIARWRQWISVALHNGVAELQHARLSAGAAQHPVGALAGGA